MSGLDLVRRPRKYTRGSLGLTPLLLKNILQDSLRSYCVPLKCTLLTISLSCCVVKRTVDVCFSCSMMPLTNQESHLGPELLTEAKVRDFCPKATQFPPDLTLRF